MYTSRAGVCIQLFCDILVTVTVQAPPSTDLWSTTGRYPCAGNEHGASPRTRFVPPVATRWCHSLVSPFWQRHTRLHCS